MVYSRTILTVADNSGAKFVKAIAVLGSKKRYYGKLYDSVLVVPKKIKRRGKSGKRLVQKRRKYIALIVTTAINTRRRDGSFIKFLATSAVLFGLNLKLLGSALRVPMCRESTTGQALGDVKKLVTLSRQFV